MIKIKILVKFYPGLSFFYIPNVIPAAYSSSNEAELAKTTKAKMTLKDISPLMSLMKLCTLFG